MSEPDLVTTAEAAQILGVRRETVSIWSNEKLPADQRKLSPIMRLRGRTGAKLFARSDVEALRDELKASA